MSECLDWAVLFLITGGLAMFPECWLTLLTVFVGGTSTGLTVTMTGLAAFDRVGVESSLALDAVSLLGTVTGVTVGMTLGTDAGMCIGLGILPVTNRLTINHAGLVTGREMVVVFTVRTDSVFASFTVVLTLGAHLAGCDDTWE